MSRILLLDDIRLGPADFDAWRDEIDMCACHLCSDANRSRPLDFTGRWQLVAGLVLLDALKEGRHQRKTYQQAAWDARARAIVNGTYGQPVIKVSFISAGTMPGANR